MKTDNRFVGLDGHAETIAVAVAAHSKTAICSCSAVAQLRPLQSAHDHLIEPRASRGIDGTKGSQVGGAAALLPMPRTTDMSRHAGRGRGHRATGPGVAPEAHFVLTSHAPVWEVLFPQVVHGLVAQLVWEVQWDGPKDKLTVLLDETAIAEEHAKIKRRDKERANRPKSRPRGAKRQKRARERSVL